MKGRTSAFSEYLDSLRADATREHYRFILKRLLKDPDAWLVKAKKDRHFIESWFLSYIAEERRTKESAGSTVRQRAAIVKSYLDFHEAAFNWKKVKGSLPPGNHVAHDRAPTVEELRSLLKYCGVRERFMVLAMASAGFRLGAWKSLRLRDVEYLPSGIARLTIYRKEPEEYQTFISREAVGALREYLAARERIGEKLTPESPLIRDRWSYETFGGVSRSFVAPDVPHPVSDAAIQSHFLRMWVRAGIRNHGQGRGAFKILHGFRKFVKTQSSKAGLTWEDQEILLGHYLNYYKPTPEHLEAEYLRAEPFLTVSEALQVRQEKDRMEAEHGQEWKDAQLQILTLTNNYRNLSDQYQSVLNEVALMRDKIARELERKQGGK